jgi:hypothetical protein
MREKAPLKLEFGPCCFCNMPIAPTEVDPCSVTVSTVGGEWQTWLCHSTCFRQRIAAREDDVLEPKSF